MASEVANYLGEDIAGLMKEFAIDATLSCGQSSIEAKVVLLFLPEQNEEYIGSDIVAIVQKSDLQCDKPVVECEYGRFYTLFRENDLSGLVRLHLSRDEVKQAYI